MTNQQTAGPNRHHGLSRFQFFGGLMAVAGLVIGAAGGWVIGGCTLGFGGYWGPMGLEWGGLGAFLGLVSGSFGVGVGRLFRSWQSVRES